MENALGALYRAAFDAGDADTARKLGQARVELGRAMGSARLEFTGLWALVEVAGQQESPTDQLTASARIMELARETGSSRILHDAREAHMSALLALERHDEGAAEIATWIAEASPWESREVIRWGATAALTLERAGRHEEAWSLWKTYLPPVLAGWGSETALMSIKSALTCALEEGDKGMALKLSESLLQAASKSDDPEERKKAVRLRMRALRENRLWGCAVMLAFKDAFTRYR